MPTAIKISNYKSVFDLELELGDVSIFIGENGCGKSNILEAIAITSAAANNKLDNEFLFSRGIRVTSPEFMLSAFDKTDKEKKIKIHFKNTPIEIAYNEQTKKWDNFLWIKISDSIVESIVENFDPELVNFLNKANPNNKEIKILGDMVRAKVEDKIIKTREDLSKTLIIFDFLIYSPEYSFLRNFETEGQIQPFGIRGEGVFKYIKNLIQEKNIDKLNEIKEHLQVFDWFDDIVTDNGKTFTGDYTLKLKDRYIDSEFDYFDHKSTNEGFLFVLFYICVMVHENTPEFFAIENIEASLNPKLCTELVKLLVKMSSKYNKKIILTTHNPAVLDGIDLKDDNQRLFRIYRNKSGHTKALRIADKSDIPEGSQVKLSEAFMRGYLGGLPTSF
ncbi:MAG: AAA family ATPase [Leptospiraceae bacterium]|nr:AAA family ATPase [Leptospiraceae bacterium]